MNCDEALAAFTSHLDGEELETGDAEALDDHLAQCTACRAQAEELAATHRDLLALRAAEAVRAEPEADATRGRIQPATVRLQELPPRHSRWIEAAAAVVLAAVLAFLLWPETPSTGNGSVERHGTRPDAPVPSRVGLVSASQGHVEGRTGNAGKAVPLQPGSELLAGQEIRVTRDSFAELDMQGGVRMRLEAVSLLRFGAGDEPYRVFLVTGKGRFEVTARNAPWRLQTPNATVESLGGVFVVTVEERGDKR